MRTFTTIIGAFNYVKKNATTGNEKSINDRLFFGVKTYAYSQDVELSGHSALDSVYTPVENDSVLKDIISWSFQTDGYLIVQ